MDQSVDMGSECDQKLSVCRSRNAVCEPIGTQPSRSINPHKVPANFLWPNIVDFSAMAEAERNGPTKICQCPKMMVEVYQSTLSYTECSKTSSVDCEEMFCENVLLIAQSKFDLDCEKFSSLGGIRTHALVDATCLFPQLSASATHCHLCVSSGGICYDLNNDGIGDGCVCPPHKSLSSKMRSTGEQACSVTHVSLNCSDGHFSVCYRPHTHQPFEHLTSDLSDGKAVVQLIPTDNENSILLHEYNMAAAKHIVQNERHTLSFQSSFASQIRDPCELSKIGATSATLNDRMGVSSGVSRGSGGDRNTPEQYCLHLDAWKMKQSCGIRLYSLGENSIQYEGLLEVMVDRSQRTPNKDLQIPLKCIAPRPKRAPIKNEFLSDPGRPSEQPTDMEFRVVNAENKEIYATPMNTMIRLDALLLDQSEIAASKIPSTVRDYPLDSAVRQLNFPTVSSSPAASKSHPCHFALCLNTTHLAWLCIGILTLIMLFTLVMLFLYKKRQLNHAHTKPRTSKKQTTHQHLQQTQSHNPNYEPCAKLMSNRPCVPNYPLGEVATSQAQSFLRVPACLLSTTPRGQESFTFEQQNARESGIMSPVFFAQDSGCPDGSDSQLFCFRESAGRPTASSAAISVEGVFANTNVSCKTRMAQSEAYCYCDQLPQSAIERGNNTTQTLPLERRTSRLKHFINYTRDNMDEFHQMNEDTLIAAGWQPPITNTDLLSCGYSSSEDRKQLLQTFPHSARCGGRGGGGGGGEFSDETNDSIVPPLPTHSSDLIVLNNSTNSDESDAKRPPYTDCVKTGTQHVHT
ncbi:unnamed protein product [Echinostoma caproni]|uniref:ZP domain-containing protein n=1 Tax=Echinostoma caproni TaxID=27848 RepID=A0A183A696_9TREM|nr:unnamed protein product [Echinostoma caproni]